MSCDLVPRLPYLGTLRTMGSTELGVLDAPLGHVTVVFANLVGASTLLSWDKVSVTG